MKISTLIIDDEQAARDRLQKLVERSPYLDYLSEAVDGVDALEKIAALKPQLIFLDIQMPVINGFDVLTQLTSDTLPAVIFVTAFDHYAIKAFDVAAVDYLLKPFSEERFEQAVERVSTRVEESVGQGWKDTVNALLENMPRQNFARQIAVRQLKRVRLLSVSEISYIQSEHRVIHIYDHSGNRFWTNETIAQLEQRLDPEQFFRIHRSSMINLQGQFELEPWEDGRMKILFSSGDILTVAREPAKNLRARMGF